MHPCPENCSCHCVLSWVYLFCCSKPIDLEFIANFPPNSLRSLSQTTGSQSDSGNHVPTNNHSEHQGRSLETPVYKTPTLMPPRILPLLHNLAEQLVQAGYQQQCSRIYRYGHWSSSKQGYVPNCLYFQLVFSLLQKLESSLIKSLKEW